MEDPFGMLGFIWGFQICIKYSRSMQLKRCRLFISFSVKKLFKTWDSLSRFVSYMRRFLLESIQNLNYWPSCRWKDKPPKGEATCLRPRRRAVQSPRNTTLIDQTPPRCPSPAAGGHLYLLRVGTSCWQRGSYTQITVTKIILAGDCVT